MYEVIFSLEHSVALMGKWIDAYLYGLLFYKMLIQNSLYKKILFWSQKPSFPLFFIKINLTKMRFH